MSMSTETVPEVSHSMPKWLKVSLISLGSLLGVLVIVVVVACYLIFTPARLTSIVNKLSDKYILCQSSFERVDLTLFRTFPDAGIEVKNVVLVNPMDPADLGGVASPSDSLAHLNSVIVGINVRDFLKHGDIKVTKLILDEGSANLFVAPDGTTNFDIFPPSTDTTSDQPAALPDIVELRKVAVGGLNCCFDDYQAGLHARLRNMDLTAKAKIDALAQVVALLTDSATHDLPAHLNATIRMDADRVALRVADSLGAEALYSRLDKVDLCLKSHGSTDCLKGRVALSIPTGQVRMAGEEYVTPALNGQRKDLLSLRIPYTANLVGKSVVLHDASVALAQFLVALTGTATLPSAGQPLTVDADMHTNTWQVSELLAVLPPSLSNLIPKGMEADAKFALNAHAVGAVTDTTLPLVDAQISLDNGQFAYRQALPYRFKKISADIAAHLDLSQGGQSHAVVKRFQAHTGRNQVSLTGRVDDLMGNPRADVRLKGDLQLPDLKPILPADLAVDMRGTARLDLCAKATLAQITALDIKHMKVNGNMAFSDLWVRLNNDIEAASPALSVALQIPAIHHTTTFYEVCSAVVTSGKLHAVMASAQVEADLDGTRLEAGVNNFLDTTQPLKVAATFKMAKLAATMDSMQASLTSPSGFVQMVPREDDHAKVQYTLKFNNGALFAKISDSLALDFAGLSVDGTADYDSARSNVLQQWSPNFNIDLKRAYINFAQLNYMVQVPDLKFNYRPERCEISSANVVFGNSDYYLSGSVTGLEKWISHEDMLRGDLYFTSNYTNVDDLLEAFSGMGSDPDSLQQQRQADQVPAEANPFIVPRDVDFTLHTRIKDATAFGNDLQELAGDVIVRDGVAVLDQVGFMCKAATMQLTAMYKTPRVNHIFLGMDFHLLDIGVHELIDMVPYVDTIVPMLASLDGNANFHLCAETYLDAYYRPKMSTLRGAAALTGKDLVVLDNETFNKISKLMMFKKSTRNVIDSLDVELTVFRKEVELYPFLLSMDKYQVVASGRHNLDMNYDYHLEIVRSPLPARLAVDALGVMPQVGIKLGKCRYAELYKPEKHDDLQQRTVRLKQMILESLQANVKESTRQYGKE